MSKVINGFAESTRNIHQINKEHMAAVRADSKANFDAATAPDPGLVKVKNTKGLGNKIKATGENIVEGARENSEKEKQRRADIQSHEGYRTMLQEQREKRQTTVNPTF